MDEADKRVWLQEEFAESGAGAGPDDQGEGLARLDGLSGDLGGADHQHLGIPDGAGDVFRLEIGIDGDRGTGRLEGGYHLFRQFVCDQYFHAIRL